MTDVRAILDLENYHFSLSKYERKIIEDIFGGGENLISYCVFAIGFLLTENIMFDRTEFMCIVGDNFNYDLSCNLELDWDYDEGTVIDPRIEFDLVVEGCTELSQDIYLQLRELIHEVYNDPEREGALQVYLVSDNYDEGVKEKTPMSQYPAVMFNY